MADAPAIVWFRNDLRLADNPALSAAAQSGRPLLPLFVLDELTPGRWARGDASRWWLHHSLAALQRDLARRHAPLILRHGRVSDVVPKVAHEADAGAVFWNHGHEPYWHDEVDELILRLHGNGIEVHTFHAGTLFEPGSITTGAGEPYKVFTPFWRACQAAPAPDAPLPVPKPLSTPADPPASDALEDWRLTAAAAVHLDAALGDLWSPGEAGGRARLDGFLHDGLAGYATDRDRPALPATSRLSPHLHFGEVTPRQVWHAAQRAVGGTPKRDKDADTFLKELGWREFAYHLLVAEPEAPDDPLRPEFVDFPWARNAELLRCWQEGRTGYPIVDAGMRELRQTGYMHNRVRMIAASFLVKDLLQPWQAGEQWFWRTLVDADLAANAMNWQWVAGCGTDAAPYFRVFNPTLQGRKYDPDGAYVRRWVPELAALPAAHVHEPWAAPDDALEEAGVTLGATYPEPVVDHFEARDRALDAFEQIKRTAS